MTELRTAPADGIPKVLISPKEFAAGAAALAAGSGPFAIDTERASSYRYDDRAFLVQIRRAGAGTFLFAPEGRRAEFTAALAPVLNGKDWVIHAAPSDLPCLAWLGLYPGTIFDTELASRLAGFEHPNLGAMILEIFDVELEKGHGDSDWSETPLPRSWRAYAALDVELLLELAEALTDILAEEDKLDWAYEEYDAIVAEHAGISAPPERSWRDLKGIAALRTSEQLAVARELWTRREAAARKNDVSPSRLLPNRVVVEIARQLPDSIFEINRIKGFPRRRGGASHLWFTAVEETRKSDPSTWPVLERERPDVPKKSTWVRDYPELWERYQDLREDAEYLAEDLGMSAATLFRAADLRHLVWAVCGPQHGVGGTVSRPEHIGAVLRELGAREWQVEQLEPLIARKLFR